jgi:hypothetical protein
MQEFGFNRCKVSASNDKNTFSSKDATWLIPNVMLDPDINDRNHSNSQRM